MAALRQPSGTGVALRDPFAWDVFVGLARQAATLRYSAVFLPEIAGRDAFAALSGLAGETRDITLGTGVVPMTSRTRMTTAMGAATVQERSGGRMILGVGSGRATPGALDRLRGEVVALKALLCGGESEGRRLSLVLPAVVPVWIAALGPRSVRLGGEVADGVLLNWCTPDRVADARAAVRGAAEAVGRDPDSVTIAVYVRAALGADRTSARDALKTALAEYAGYPAYARQFDLMGLGPQAGAAAEAGRVGRPRDVPDDLVDEICLSGDAARARGRLEAYHRAGADLTIVYPVAHGHRPAGSVADVIRELAPMRG